MASSQQTIELLRRVHGGEREALEELLERNLAWVHQHVRRRLGPRLRARAETVDFVQQSILDFLEYGPRFELSSESQLRALLARIVENNLRDQDRHLRRQRRDVDREVARASDTILVLDPPAKAVDTPSRILDREERQAWIRLALEFLDPEDREVLVEHEWEGKTFAEIAKALDLTESAARMRYHRALPKLASKVGQLRKGDLS